MHKQPNIFVIIAHFIVYRANKFMQYSNTLRNIYVYGQIMFILCIFKVYNVDLLIQETFIKQNRRGITIKQFIYALFMPLISGF